MRHTHRCCRAISFEKLIQRKPVETRTRYVSSVSNEVAEMTGTETMKRAFAILACVCALIGGVYFAASKWAIRHESISLYDTARSRPIAVDLAVRRDFEARAEAGYAKLAVAIISNGNTVKNTEYSFLANALAARGYLVASIQQDNPDDPPIVTKIGMPYVGREPAYHRGET